MISKKMLKALNSQFYEELGSAYLYLSMSAYFHSEGRKGMGKWMEAQTQEELTHAMKLYDYMIRSGARAEVPAIEKPKEEWISPLNVFQEALKHEKYITSRINILVEVAEAEKDYSTKAFLQWYVEEQEEEEESASEIVEMLDKVELSDDDMAAIDEKLGQRK